jgi:hypothetical protein
MPPTKFIDLSDKLVAFIFSVKMVTPFFRKVGKISTRLYGVSFQKTIIFVNNLVRKDNIKIACK